MQPPHGESRSHRQAVVQESFIEKLLQRAPETVGSERVGPWGLGTTDALVTFWIFLHVEKPMESQQATLNSYH